MSDPNTITIRLSSTDMERAYDAAVHDGYDSVEGWVAWMLEARVQGFERQTFTPAPLEPK